jgi:hypothetical protein
VTPAQKGAALLDQKIPGWEHRIDPETLEMGDPRHCVVGQICGFYRPRFYGILQMSDNINVEVAHGFRFHRYISEGPPLKRQWLAERQKRLIEPTSDRRDASGPVG